MKILKNILLVSVTFVLALSAGFGVNLLLNQNQLMQVDWDDSVGTIHTDFPYADDEKNKFDLYLPTQKGKPFYGLVVYLHAGGFTTGDKSDDTSILKYFTAKGYVSAGINYSLASDENAVSVLDMSNEIKTAIPQVVKKARELGYPINRMAMMGGSAGGALAMIYAYRDGKEAPVPVKFVFQQVGPASFEPNDWYNMGSDAEAAAAWVGMMTGKKTTPQMIKDGTYKEFLKPISAYEWVDETSPPTLVAYGKLDKVVPYATAIPLQKALEKHGVKHDFFTFPHSGHGLHRDRKLQKELYAQLENYLGTYLK